MHQLLERKVTIAEIARQLGRRRSTIYRELKRNTLHAEFATHFLPLAVCVDRRPRCAFARTYTLYD
ncbi:helix-turn-helix domain-containing protein [Sinorhizobium meliloti]|uniref:helix-turn-helix domain-containing protein n=1 Tax=Rhizobium meliloti TaxID=382 RepID=UPI001F37D1EF|nr:helix-turn-helix domain-containing protein [Sinorhizobium meliloti]